MWDKHIILYNLQKIVSPFPTVPNATASAISRSTRNAVSAILLPFVSNSGFTSAHSIHTTLSDANKPFISANTSLGSKPLAIGVPVP